MTRTWLVTDSFSNVCPHLQFRTNQRKANRPLPNQLWHRLPRAPASRGHWLSEAFHLHLSFTFLCLPLDFCQNASLGSWLPSYKKLIREALYFLIWLVLVYFHTIFRGGMPTQVCRDMGTSISDSWGPNRFRKHRLPVVFLCFHWCW